jgi:hypothetical protein
MAYKKVTGIYSIWIEGRQYIGSAVCIKGRINMHKRELRNGNHPNFILQKAFNENLGVMSVIILEVCEREVLRLREQYFIDANQGELMNLTREVCELAPAEEHSRRMAAAWAKRTPEQRAALAKKISDTMKRKYQENPELLKLAQEGLILGRATENLKKNKTSAGANKKRSDASKKQWAARNEQERKNVGGKIRAGMLEKMTPEQRSNVARKGALSRKY